MILECAVLDVKPGQAAEFEAAFAKAQAIISASPGYLSHELQRCLEKPKAGVDRDDDYLGLRVWLRCFPGRWSSFEVFRNTDSSSI